LHLSLVVWPEHCSAVPAQVPAQVHPDESQAPPVVKVVQSGEVPAQLPMPSAQRHPDSLAQVVLSVRLGQVGMVPLHTPDPGDQ
jgi:hypothetical protein